MGSNPNSIKILKFSIIANVLEWYEFTIYGFLASIIGELFFKSNTPTLSVMYAFFVFALSFLARPFGGIFFGYLGDKYGRVISLQLSTLMMSIPTIFIGLLPTYDSWGAISVGLLIALRLIQGFAAGGELPSSACLVYENSTRANRGLLCSSVSMSSLMGVMLGSLVASLLFNFLDKKTMIDWGWRIPFLLGIPITTIIIYLRNLLTLDHASNNRDKTDILVELINSRLKVFITIILVGFMQSCFYLMFVWMPSYLTHFINVDINVQLVNTIGLCALGLFILASGYLSKFLSKESIMIFSSVGMLVVTFPAFSLLPNISFTGLVIIQVVFSLFLGGISGVMFAFLGDIYKQQIRCSGMNLSFTFATSLLGGVSPAICSYFINISGYTMFPAVFIIVFSLLALLALMKIRASEERYLTI